MPVNLLAMEPVGADVKTGRIVPATANHCSGVADGVIPEEDEQPVVKNRSTDRAAILVVLGIVALRIVVRIVRLISIEPGAIQFEKRGAVKLICAVLRNDLDLCAAEPAQFGVIGIRDDLHFLDGVGIGRNDRGRAPGHAGDLHAVNRDAIGIVAAAVAEDLRLVLGHDTDPSLRPHCHHPGCQED